MPTAPLGTDRLPLPACPRKPCCGTLAPPSRGLWAAGSSTCETQKLKKEAAASLWPLCSLLWAHAAGIPVRQQEYVWTGTSSGPGRPHLVPAPPWGWGWHTRRVGVCPGSWCSRGARGAGLHVGAWPRGEEAGPSAWVCGGATWAPYPSCLQSGNSRGGCPVDWVGPRWPHRALRVWAVAPSPHPQHQPS